MDPSSNFNKVLNMTLNSKTLFSLMRISKRNMSSKNHRQLTLGKKRQLERDFGSKQIQAIGSINDGKLFSQIKIYNDGPLKL